MQHHEGDRRDPLGDFPGDGAAEVPDHVDGHDGRTVVEWVDRP